MKVRVEGLSEVDAQLARLKPATAKAALRRVLKAAAEPLAAQMGNGAPDDPATGGNDLRRSIGVGTKLSKRQAGLHRKMFADERAAVEMFVGAGPVPHAHLQEFGTRRHAPQPFARPAWDGDKDALLERIADGLGAEVEKTVARAAKAGKLVG